MKVLLILFLLLLPMTGWSQFVFFDKDFKQVKEKKAVYFSDAKFSGKGDEYLVVKPAPGTGLDTVLVTFHNGRFEEKYAYEWEEVSDAESNPHPGVEPEVHGDEKLENPEQDKPDGVGRKIFVRFIVTERGELKDIKVLKNNYPALSAEAVRKIKQHSKEEGWKPAYHRGQAVPVEIILPINFKLGTKGNFKNEP